MFQHYALSSNALACALLGNVRGSCGKQNAVDCWITTSCIKLDHEIIVSWAHAVYKWLLGASGARFMPLLD